MRKILFFATLSFLFTSVHLHADKYQPHKEGEVFEGFVEFYNGKYQVSLPAGKFKLIATHTRRVEGGGNPKFYELLFAKLEGKTFEKIVNLKFSRPANSYWKTPKDCKRTNMFFIEKYLSGKAFNCWYVNHHTLELTSNKIKANTFNGKIRDYVVKNGIIMPNFSIYSRHIYSSPRHRNIWFEVNYYVNPTKDGMPEVPKTSWKYSDYNVLNLSKFPKKKKYMENYVKMSAAFQKSFEDGINIRPEHRLNTSTYITKTTQSKKSKIDKSLTDEIDKLNKLFKSGAITEEEFKKAKSKLLN